MVDSAVFMAKTWGVSDLVIGATLVAVGTSLPEVATTVVAALRGAPELAVGNAIGSNVFNVLCVLGFTSLALPIPVAFEAMQFEFWFMFAACVLVWLFMLSFAELARKQGLVFLAAYLFLCFIRSLGELPQLG